MQYFSETFYYFYLALFLFAPIPFQIAVVSSFFFFRRHAITDLYSMFSHNFPIYQPVKLSHLLLWPVLAINQYASRPLNWIYSICCSIDRIPTEFLFPASVGSYSHYFRFLFHGNPPHIAYRNFVPSFKTLFQANNLLIIAQTYEKGQSVDLQADNFRHELHSFRAHYDDIVLTIVVRVFQLPVFFALSQLLFQISFRLRFLQSEPIFMDYCLLIFVSIIAILPSAIALLAFVVLFFEYRSVMDDIFVRYSQQQSLLDSFYASTLPFPIYVQYPKLYKLYDFQMPYVRDTIAKIRAQRIAAFPNDPIDQIDRYTHLLFRGMVKDGQLIDFLPVSQSGKPRVTTLDSDDESSTDSDTDTHTTDAPHQKLFPLFFKNFIVSEKVTTFGSVYTTKDGFRIQFVRHEDIWKIDPHSIDILVRFPLHFADAPRQGTFRTGYWKGGGIANTHSRYKRSHMTFSPCDHSQPIHRSHFYDSDYPKNQQLLVLVPNLQERTQRYQILLSTEFYVKQGDQHTGLELYGALCTVSIPDQDFRNAGVSLTQKEFKDYLQRNQSLYLHDAPVNKSPPQFVSVALARLPASDNNNASAFNTPIAFNTPLSNFQECPRHLKETTYIFVGGVLRCSKCFPHAQGGNEIIEFLHPFRPKFAQLFCIASLCYVLYLLFSQPTRALFEYVGMCAVFFACLNYLLAEKLAQFVHYALSIRDSIPNLFVEHVKARAPELATSLRDEASPLVQQFMNQHGITKAIDGLNFRSQNNVHSRLSQYFHTDPLTLSIGEEILSLLGTSYICWNSEQKSTKGIAAALYLRGSFHSPLFEYLYKCVPALIDIAKGIQPAHDALPVAHGGEPAALPTAFRSLVNTFFPMFSSQDEHSVSLKQEAHAISLVRSSLGLVKDASTFCNWLLHFVFSCYKICYYKATGFPYACEESKLVIDKAIDWYQKCSQFILQYPSGPSKIEITATLRNYLDLCSLGDLIALELVEHQFSVRNFQSFFVMHNQIRSLAKDAAIQIQALSYRSPPTWVFFQGPPGTGKTTVMTFLIKDVMSALDLDYTAQSTFDRKNYEFWDGYKSQFCCTFDDIFQSTDTDERREQAMDLIYACNGNQFPLNMASLEGKGTCFFTSQLVVSTTNTTSIGAIGIIENDALSRRRDFVVNTSKSPQPYDGAADHLDLSDPDYLALAHARFTLVDRFDSKTAVPNCEDLSYPALLKIVLDKVKIRMSEKGSLQKKLVKEPRITDRLTAALNSNRTVPENYFTPVRNIPISRANNNNPPAKQSRNRWVDADDHIKAQMGKEEEILLIPTGSVAIKSPAEIDQMPDPTIDLPDITPEEFKRIDKALKEASESVEEISRRVDKIQYLINLSKEARQKVREMTNKLREQAMSVPSEVPKTALALGVVLGGFFAMKGAYHLLKPLIMDYFTDTVDSSFTSEPITPLPTTDLAQQSVGAAAPKASRQAKRLQSRRNSKFKKISAKAQSGNCVAETLMESFNKNFRFFLSCTKDALTIRRVPSRCFFIRDTIAVFAQHTIARYRSDLPFWIEMDGVKWPRENLNVVTNDELDIAFIQFIPDSKKGLLLSSFPDVTSHFCKEDDIERENFGQVCLAVINEEDRNFSKRYGNSSMRLTVSYKMEDDVIHTLPVALQIAMKAESGECGSPYFAMDNSFNRHILGIHVAGSKAGTTVCTFVTQEQIEQAVNELIPSKADSNLVSQGGGPSPIEYIVSQSVPSQGYFDEQIRQITRELQPYLDPTASEELCQVRCGENSTFIGKLLPLYTPRPINKTHIVPSLFQQQHLLPEPTTAPAVLRITPDGVSPMQKRMLKADLPVHDIAPEDMKLLDEIALFMAAQIPCEGVPARVFTEHEALNGIRGLNEFGSIETNKASGFPLNVEDRKGSLKSYWLQNLGTYQEPIWIIPENRLRELINNIKEGHRLPAAINIFLKDERLDLEKIAQVDTRLIYSGAFAKFIVDRQYFGAFSAAIMKHHQTGRIKLGFNPFSYSDVYSFVSQATNHLSSPKVSDPDIKGCDRSMQYACGYFADKTARYWYGMNDPSWTPEDDKFREFLTTADLQALCIALDNVHVKKFLNPSGCFMTSVRNSLHNIGMFLLAYIRFKESQGIRVSIAEAYQALVTLAFGDDGVNSHVDDSCDSVQLAAILKKRLGVTLQNSHKAKELTSFTPWEEAQFLKRTFRNEGGVWLAPLHESVLIESLNWVTNTMEPKEALLMNIEGCMREYFHHGKKAHTQFCYEMIHLMNTTEIQFRNRKSLQKAMNWEDLYIDYVGETTASAPLLVAQSGSEIVTPITNSVVENTASSDSQGTQAIVPLVQGPFPHSLMDVHVYRPDNMHDVLERTYSITIPWTAATSQDTVLWNALLPWEIIDAFPNLEQKLNRYQFFRANMEFTFRVNGSQFYAGALMIGYLPYSTTNTNGTCFANVYDMSMCQGVTVLLAGEGKAVTVMVPYITPLQMINLSHPVDDGGEFGQIVVMVMNPLTLANSSTVTDLTLTINVRFRDAEVAGPTVYTIPKSKDRQNIDRRKQRRERYNYFLKQQEKIANDLRAQSGQVRETREGSKTGQITKTLGKISKIMPFLKPLPYVGQAATIASPIVEVLAGVSGVLGLDAPTVDKAPGSQVIRYDNMAFGRGMRNALKVSLSPDAMCADSPNIFGKSIDEMDMNVILQKPYLIKTMSITPANAKDSILFQFPINPSICYWHIETTSTPQVTEQHAHYHAGHMAFMSTVFEKWRGGMNFLIQVVAPAILTARIRITHLPSAHHVPANTSDGAGDYHSHIYDIRGSQLIKFNVPYEQNKPQLRVVPYHTVSPATSNSGYVVDNLDECNGMIQCALLNTVAGADGSANATIYLNVFVAGGADMELFQLRDLWDGFTVAQSGVDRVTTIPVPQELEVSAPDSLDAIFKSGFEPIVPPVTVNLRAKLEDSEKISNLRDIIHRPTHGWTLNLTTAKILDWRLDDSFTPVSKTNFLWYFSQMYMFARGSVRLQLQMIGQAGAPIEGKWCATVVPNSYTELAPGVFHQDVNRGGAGIVKQNYLDNRVIEFEIPYTNTCPFYTVDGDQQNFFEDTDNLFLPKLVFEEENTTPAVPNTVINLSAGDDFLLGILKKPPHLAYRMPDIARKVDNNNSPLRLSGIEKRTI